VGLGAGALSVLVMAAGEQALSSTSRTGKIMAIKFLFIAYELPEKRLGLTHANRSGYP
jgi:hypothetical protein